MVSLSPMLVLLVYNNPVLNFQLAFLSLNSRPWGRMSSVMFGLYLKVFHREGATIDRHKLPVTVSAKYIRFHPINRHNWNCLRVEAYSNHPPGTY